MVFKKKKQPHLADKVACVILAGGQGTRLFPLTKERCKPAVIFGGRYRLIDVPISNSLNSQFTNIFIISQFLATTLNHYIQQSYQLDRFQGGSIDLLSPEETVDHKHWYEGTADAVRKNLHNILKTPFEYFLILSGDQLYHMDLEKMVAFAKKKDADLTIATLPIEETEAHRMGIMKIDEEYNIVDFVEKPKEKSLLHPLQLPDPLMKKNHISLSSPCYLASMGIYVFKRDVLIRLLEEDPREDFGKHLIPTQMKKGKTAAFLYQGYWEDIGTVKSYYDANLSLTTKQLGLNLYDEENPIYCRPMNVPCAHVIQGSIENSLVCQGSVIEAKEITNSLIGVRNRIKKGCVIQNSILLGNQFFSPPKLHVETMPKKLEIGEQCHFKNVIIDENVRIGNHVQLINKQNLTTYDGEGIYIRDGIIIVSSGTTLPDHFVL